MDRSGRIKVAIVDEQRLFTDCLGLVLDRRNYSHCVVPVPEGCGQTNRLLARLLAVRPDVLLLNAELGQVCDGGALIAPMTRAGVAVVVITESASEAQWGWCLERGARLVLSKNESMASVLSVVRRVSQDQPVLERSERDRLIGISRQQDMTRRDAQERLQKLSPQEAEILRHLMSGRTVREIAVVRVVSEATVRTQVKAILAKLNLQSQLAAVAAAHLGGWGVRPLPIAG
ncbi:helix-turn-helix transcriptional regulator [Nocardioides sp. URHA0020]|uniref:helix-turn-helix transcriptional regulator n=1 Tax=Nocardioides sp. URHA0020 TaxID=1380392 RepID=UPI0005652B08|nr:response regulator transcription factor [Nocardioides sp. URHA0020]